MKHNLRSADSRVLEARFGSRFGKAIRSGRAGRDRTARRAAPECRPARARPDRHDVAARRRLLRDLRALVLRQRRRRHRRLRRPDAEARLRQRRQSALDAQPRREVHLAHADRRVAELSRLRRQELLPRQSGVRHRGRLQAARRRGASSRHQGARRPGAQPRVERAPVLQGGAARPGVAASRTGSASPPHRATTRDRGASSSGTSRPSATSTTTGSSAARCPT